MSEERFDRIEAQISELREMMQQNMTAMQQNITAMQQDITATKQNLNALSEDVVALRHRMDSIEGTVVVTMREGFESFRNYIDDLNYDLANNERRTRRLSRRVDRLERNDDK
jgi:septal ring factor EnvC (AmiA/AmiB activator)